MISGTYINGEWIDPDKPGSTIYPLNPANCSVLAEIRASTVKDVREACSVAREAYEKGIWSELTPQLRSSILLKVANIISAMQTDLAKKEALNQGKTFRQAISYDLPYAVDNILFFAGASRDMTAPVSGNYSGEGESSIKLEPMGVVAAIVPWNYPLGMAIWRVIPALATGNSVVLKPASYTPMTALDLPKIFRDAGIPDGVFNLLTGSGKEIGEEFSSNKNVDMVSFTGGTEAGKRIYENGSKNLKKISLELGGKAPFIVFSDADMEAALNGAIEASFINNGEDCAAATRIYIQESAYESFTSRLVERISGLKVGNQMDKYTDIGPLVSMEHLKKVLNYVDLGRDDGGRLLIGGTAPDNPALAKGSFFNPTVMEIYDDNSAVIKEEIFAPFVTVSSFDTVEDAVERANAVEYGLGSSIWTKDIYKATRIAAKLDFGTVWVNDHIPVPSEMPWPSRKVSGQGVSLSRYALEECTKIKHVYIDSSAKPRRSWHIKGAGNI